MYSGSMMPRMSARPAGSAAQGASVVLGAVRVTCDQWLSLSAPWRASLVRKYLEGRGFPSLSNSTRGSVVYDMVARINAYCGAQRRIAPAGSAKILGVNMPGR